MRNASGQVFPTRVMNVLAPFAGSATLPVARARAETDQAAFFQSFTPGNFEVGVKMVDACASAGRPPSALLLDLLRRPDQCRDRGARRAHADRDGSTSGATRADTLPTAEARTNAFPCP